MVLPDLKLNRETVTLSAHELIQIHASCFDEPHLQAIHEITQAGPLQRICLLFKDQIYQSYQHSLSKRV